MNMNTKYMMLQAEAYKAEELTMDEINMHQDIWGKYEEAASNYNESNQYQYCGELEKMVEALADIIYKLQVRVGSLEMERPE